MRAGSPGPRVPPAQVRRARTERAARFDCGRRHVTAEQAAFNMPVAGLTTVPLAAANRLLAEWGHYLGPCNRPFGSQAWVLELDGLPVSVAVSASAVSATAGGYERGQVVELARLCSGERWATRPMLRLWREIAAPRWPYWPVAAAIAYSQNARHSGDLYRFDGWTKVTDKAGSSGGGAWSRKRYATDAVHGPKTLWLWPYADLSATQGDGTT